MQSLARRVLVLASSTVLATAIVGTTPAWAGSDEQIATARGAVGWFHDGDRIVVSDSLGDGRSIEANYRRDTNSAPIHVLHVAGAGNSNSDTWNLIEGTNIEIRMCYREGSVVTKCSGWQNAEA